MHPSPQADIRAVPAAPGHAAEGLIDRGDRRSVRAPLDPAWSPQGYLGARLRREWIVPIARDAPDGLESFGSWSDEIALAWSPEPPDGR